ncbi:MAG: helix-turn-helix transcriptional regulator [Pseudobutyrivibrio sp.]|nr:helix-turn-helix transcriptional regulator [Pseudobutyrivibrio sp.]
MKDRYVDGVVTPQAMAARHSVAQELRDTRHQLNMTQESLADLVGTKKSNISRMESGKYNPSLDFLVKVADSLGKNLDVHLID